MKAELEKRVAAACQELFGAELQIELTRPEERFGDYATNAALQLAGRLNKPPREVAESLAVKLRETLAGQVSEVSIAGPGFINLRMSDSALLKELELSESVRTDEDVNLRISPPLANKTVVAEYSDPNPFKVLHAGHLYTSVVGDAIANLLEQAGATVHRVNFGGDVGLHAAKTMWAILRKLGGENPDKLADIPEKERSEWMAGAYIEGTKAYDEDEPAKAEIAALNKRIYQLHTDTDHDSPFAHIYWTCRGWSYDYFNAFYERIGTKFEKYYPESETAPLGLQTVREHTGDVYEESDGAVIFDGEKHGLHTRVFITSEGLPTYEAKDVGLIMQKWQDYRFDQSVVITGNDIIEYMKVVLKSIEQFMPELPARSRHLTHGLVKLAGSGKMSSRHGNILRAADVLQAAAAANRQLTGKDSEQTVLGAVKYAFLKQRTGGDIIYDPAESVSLEGNSGPYLQYAHARARSILRKAEGTPAPLASLHDADLEAEERSLLRKLTEYPEAADAAAAELMPHYVCTYLYELAQTFNRFYENNRVIGNERQVIRLALVENYANILKAGLDLLGIAAPEQM